MEFIYNEDYPSKDAFNELSAFTDVLQEQINKLDEMVFAHEEVLSNLICALLNEPCLSEETMTVVKESYDILYSPDKTDENGK